MSITNEDIFSYLKLGKKYRITVDSGHFSYYRETSSIYSQTYYFTYVLHANKTHFYFNRSNESLCLKYYPESILLSGNNAGKDSCFLKLDKKIMRLILVSKFIISDLAKITISYLYE
jgi:hypothetical protein